MADHEEIFAERKRRARIVDALKVTLEGAKPYEPSDFVDVVGAFMKPDEDTFQARRRLRARVAELEEAISADMSFEDAKELIDLKRMMRHQGADWKKAMHKHRAERGEPIPTQPWGNEDELNARRAAKRKERKEREAAVEARLAKLEAALATPPLPYPDESDPQTEELERLRAERDAEKARADELQRQLDEASVASPPPPNPAEVKLSEYGEVGKPDPVEEEITTEHLIEALRADPEAAGDAVSKLSREKRKRFTELLNVELAELQQLHGAAGENLERERDIEKLLGLFARVGEI